MTKSRRLLFTFSLSLLSGMAMLSSCSKNDSGLCDVSCAANSGVYDNGDRLALGRSPADAALSGAHYTVGIPGAVPSVTVSLRAADQQLIYRELDLVFGSNTPADRTTMNTSLYVHRLVHGSTLTAYNHAMLQRNGPDWLVHGFWLNTEVRDFDNNDLDGSYVTDTGAYVNGSRPATLADLPTTGYGTYRGIAQARVFANNHFAATSGIVPEHMQGEMYAFIKFDGAGSSFEHGGIAFKHSFNGGRTANTTTTLTLSKDVSGSLSEVLGTGEIDRTTPPTHDGLATLTAEQLADEDNYHSDYADENERVVTAVATEGPTTFTLFLDLRENSDTDNPMDFTVRPKRDDCGSSEYSCRNGPDSRGSGLAKLFGTPLETASLITPAGAPSNLGGIFTYNDLILVREDNDEIAALLRIIGTFGLVRRDEEDVLP